MNTDSGEGGGDQGKGVVPVTSQRAIVKVKKTPTFTGGINMLELMGASETSALGSEALEKKDADKSAAASSSKDDKRGGAREADSSDSTSKASSPNKAPKQVGGSAAQENEGRNIRVRVFQNGAPVKNSAGKLVLINLNADWAQNKSKFLRATGKSGDATSGRVFLLPDGEEVSDTSFLREDDRVSVSFGDDFKRPSDDLFLKETVSDPIMSSPKTAHKQRNFGKLNVQIPSRSLETEEVPSPASPPPRNKTPSPASSILKRKISNAVVRPNLDESSSSSKKANASGTVSRFRKFGNRVKLMNKLRTKTNRQSAEEVDQVTTAKQTLEACIEDICNIYKYNERRPSTENQIPWYILMPEAPWRLGWNFVIIALVLFYAAAVPIRVAFNTDAKSVAGFDVFADLVFIFDIFMNFLTTYKANGLWVVDLAVIRWTYLRSWFLVDLVASVPIDWFTSDDGGNYGAGESSGGDLNKILRMLRLFKLFRMFRLGRYFRKIEASFRFNPSLVRFAKSFAGLLATWHIIGCVYWYISEVEYGGIVNGCDLYCANASCAALNPNFDADCARCTNFTIDPYTYCSWNKEHINEPRCSAEEFEDAKWHVFRDECIWTGTCDLLGSRDDVNTCGAANFNLPLNKIDDPYGGFDTLTSEKAHVAYDLNPDVWVPHPELANATTTTKYLQSVFWAVEVTTGIGDDIIPNTDQEVIFTIGMTIVGLLVYSIIIGSASSALANMDSTASLRRQTLDKINEYLRYRRVPSFFQKIILDFYEHTWSCPTDESEVLADLPDTLRTRLSLVLNRDLVERVPIFSKFSADEFIKIIQQLRPVTYLPGEYIVKQGSNGDCMYFIKRGLVDILVTMKLDESAQMPPSSDSSERKETRRGSGILHVIGKLRRDSTSSQASNASRMSNATAASRQSDGRRRSSFRGRRDSFNGWTHQGDDLIRTSIVATLTAGDYFGESALISGAKRNASCRAVDYVDVLTLSKKNFEDVASSKEVLEEITAVAVKRREAIHEIRKKESKIYDVGIKKKLSGKGKKRPSSVFRRLTTNSSSKLSAKVEPLHEEGASSKGGGITRDASTV